MVIAARGTLNKQVTIPAGSGTSGVITTGPFTSGGVIMPSTLDGTALTFLGSHDPAGTFVAVEDAAGAAVAVTVEPSKAYAIPAAVMAFPYIKLVMGTNQSTTDTVVIITLKG